MTAERVDGSRQLNFVRLSTPEEVNRHQNGIGLSARRPDNPSDLLLDIFQQRGYPFEFTPTDRLGAEMTAHGEAFDVFCYNPDFRANFKVREAIISQLPMFRFLSLVAQGEYADLELVEQIAAGNFAEVQGKFPAAEHIELSPEEMRQSLARAYHERAVYLVAAPDYHRRFMGRYNKQMAAFEEQMPATQRHDMQMPQSRIDQVAQGIRERNAGELEAIREKQQGLGVDPIPAERIRELVSALADRTEAFIAGK